MSTRTLMLLLLGLCLAVSPAMAKEITVFDEDSSGAAGTWHNRGTDPGEDQETEPGTIANQLWDMEAMYLQGTTLILVGGWNFLGYSGEKSGDIFIDNTGDGRFGTGIHAYTGPAVTPGSTTTERYGYDYVLDVDWDTGAGYDSNGTATRNWDLRSMLNASVVTTVDETINTPASNPYRYSGNLDSAASGSVTIQKYTTDALLDTGLGFTTGLLGGTHYTATFDLASVLPLIGWVDMNDTSNPNLLFHFTQSCGNDNLMGFLSNRDDAPPPIVPEPTTMTLLGLGIAGMITLQMRRKATRA